jgi:RNA polymerase sigma-70 factor (ECF subfamily)
MDPTRDLLLSSCPGRAAAPELEASLALFARARDGDRAALDALVRRHHEQLLRVVRIRLGPAMRRFVESGDILQEAYQALVQSIATVELERGEDLVQWLTRVATNRIRDQHDRVHAEKRDPRRSGPLEAAGSEAGGAGELATDDTAPPEGAMRNEVREVLDAAIAALSPEYREAIVLRDFCGASWEHVARALGRDSVHAAQQLHQRAWIKVRKLAEPRLGGAPGGET